MRAKLIILGCGSSVGVPRIDGFLLRNLPENVLPAYDGLTLNLQNEKR